MKLSVWEFGIIMTALCCICPSPAACAEPNLVGHWKLLGDCRDYSGHGNHGINHDVDLERGAFDGTKSYIEVPASNSLKVGTGNFAVSVWIHTDDELDDIVGDVIDLYDPALRRGITLTVNSGGGGYQSQGTDRNVHFGIDNARNSDWQDCGHPNPASNYVSNSLTVYKGKLYAATTGGRVERDWRRVFRYEGDQNWADCGQVGAGRSEGVGPLIVHNGHLYAVTTTTDWTRVQSGSFEPGRVYRYLGGTQWEDCGQPSDNRTLNCIASYKGELYVGGGPETYGIFSREQSSHWCPSKLFPHRQLPDGCFPHSMCRYNGKLYVGYPGIYAYDGSKWDFAGESLPPDQSWFLQTHTLGIFQGKLLAGTWPGGKVTVYQGEKTWTVMGQVGQDAMEVQALTVYNGKLYGGSIPRAEVCRYDGTFDWTSLKRFYSPAGYDPGLPGKMTKEQVNEATRVTSLVTFDGQLFASIGSSTSSIQDAPADVRGKVFRIKAGNVASLDDDLGPGWKHLIAMRKGGQLQLFVDAKMVAESTSFDSADYDVSTEQPLIIGFGETDYFAGKMADVRLYNVALSQKQIFDLYSERAH